MSETYPPNWDARPRVEPWNGHITRQGWAEKSKDDLLGIVELLNNQLTKAQQDIRDETYLADWQRFRILRDVRVGARIYVALTRARGQGRKTIRIDDLLKEAIR
ncbi:hypothetical protein [Rhodococcus qingshengii]|uniref:Uncharacterized protein n=1 Tax=Rhodococcus qingshengii TaxID=334542 RepID=A0A2A5J170_RHOSG|nr:hypothetical protein [Rhodococcus qingshengii]PCK23263.1 hypothetical protein CHR55_30400 [Rhodococcus qingshengii]